VVNERGQSYLKYAGQPNLKGPILAPNGDEQSIQVCGVPRGTLALIKAKGALLYLHLR